MNSGKRFEFFEMKTPRDLFAKVEEDLRELEASFQDTKVAYNFFITAEHLPDWLGMRELVRKNCILRIVSHIANGAKHLNLKDQRHKSVQKAKKYRYLPEGYVEPGYVEEPLVISLSQEEAEEMGCDEIDAVSLGKMVANFWRPHVEKA